MDYPATTIQLPDRLLNHIDLGNFGVLVMTQSSDLSSSLNHSVIRLLNHSVPYRLATFLYHAAIHLAARLGRAKAAEWVAGRKNWRADLTAWRTAHPGPLVWMHCASLGEFEQGRPVLEAIRAERPDLVLLLTFYSPSGYESRKNYPGADGIFYLPADSPRAAHDWQATLHPDLAIFVKYEFWLFHLRELARAGVPTVLIAASFRPGQAFFRRWGGGYRRALHNFAHLFVQTEQDVNLLTTLPYPAAKITRAGDPRLDRVLQLPAESFSDSLLEAFAADHHLIIAGSTWPADEEKLVPAFQKFAAGQPGNWKLLLVPHDVSEAHVAGLHRSTGAPRYTQTERGEATASHVLIVDAIGLLNRLYRLGEIAYIGGGFGSGIHNTLEPMAYGLPVVFGPKYAKFPEAVQAVASGAGRSVSDTDTIVSALTAFTAGEPIGDRARTAVQEYLRANRGATGVIMRGIRAYLPKNGY